MDDLLLTVTHNIFVFYVVNCQEPTIDNGKVNCSLGDDGIYSFEDTCDVLCNLGFTLSGSGTKMCLSDASWSNVDAICERGTDFTQAACIYMALLAT